MSRCRLSGIVWIEEASQPRWLVAPMSWRCTHLLFRLSIVTSKKMGETSPGMSQTDRCLSIYRMRRGTPHHRPNAKIPTSHESRDVTFDGEANQILCYSAQLCGCREVWTVFSANFPSTVAASGEWLKEDLARTKRDDSSMTSEELDPPQLQQSNPVAFATCSCPRRKHSIDDEPGREARVTREQSGNGRRE